MDASVKLDRSGRLTSRLLDTGTKMQRITARVPVWLLSATEALATYVDEHADILKAIATILVAIGMLCCGSDTVSAAIEIAGAVGDLMRALVRARRRRNNTEPT